MVIRRPRQQRSHTNFLNFLISGKNTVFPFLSVFWVSGWAITYRSILNCRSWRWEVELTDYNSCRTIQKDRNWWRSNQAVLSMPIPWLAGIPIPWHYEWLDKDSVILSHLSGVTVTSALTTKLRSAIDSLCVPHVERQSSQDNHRPDVGPGCGRSRMGARSLLSNQRISPPECRSLMSS